MPYYTYVVECADGSLYTGWTNDLLLRLEKHNAGLGARYTRGRRPVKLITSWMFESKSEAMSWEWHFKQLSRREKLHLLAGNQAALSP